MIRVAAATFKGELPKVLRGMDSKESELKLSALAKVMLENFLFMFLSASGIGFTLSSLGVLNPAHDIYVFTVSFSTFWGMVGAAAAWSRSSADIRMPELFTSVLEAAGVDTTEKNLVLRFTRYVRADFARRIFIPFVQAPKC